MGKKKREEGKVVSFFGETLTEKSSSIAESLGYGEHFVHS